MSYLSNTKFDVIIVGAGPAGSTAAYTLAKNGLRVVVLERGRTAGSKTLYGGRVYSKPLEEVYENFRKEAPIERWVKKERFSFMSNGELLTLEYSSTDSTSFTAYLSRLASWMAQKAEEAGAVIVTDIRVDDLYLEDGVVKGVRCGDEVLRSNVVVDAEGVNRLILERFGMVPKLEKRQVALGLKQVIRLDASKIEGRLGLAAGEGLAWLIVGEATGYLPGGSFLYTNSSTISLGLVVFLEEAYQNINQHVFNILEDLKQKQSIKEVIADGVVIEYGAHLTPEMGLGMSPKKMYGDGLLIVGDAAGLLLNLGYTIRGVDFAAYSGYLAAKTILKAHSMGSYNSESLSFYQKLLEESFIMKEMKKHKKITKLMRSNEMFTIYPGILLDTVKKLFEIEYSSPTILQALRNSIKGKTSLLKLLWNIFRTFF
ncbi:MAG: FAD-dependent oxidoreductase [Aigarchaeota archaeon]|nr:FAD-dependent oxidoreductase [Aigarchaeota archaeon]MCX8192450.1 FAD-dependent oxidoreductase [Nitrososphaeria archaeon]MDW7986656.1 FAD-dependent oxidoreductase [Nitrososphaerota archaeon]